MESVGPVELLIILAIVVLLFGSRSSLKPPAEWVRR